MYKGHLINLNLVTSNQPLSLSEIKRSVKKSGNFLKTISSPGFCNMIN